MTMKMIRVLGLLVFLGSFVVSVVLATLATIQYLTPAPIIIPTSTPIVIPQSTPIAQDILLAELQNKIATQQVQIDTLSRNTEYEFRDVRWILDAKLYIAAAILSIAAVFGITGYNSIDEKVKEKINLSLDKEIRELLSEIRGLNPAYLRINIPAELEKEIDRLKRYGFRDIRKYSHLDKGLLKGIIVVNVKNREDAELCERFIRETSPDPLKVGIIVYTKERVVEAYKLTDIYDPLMPANTPMSLTNAIFLIGRSLSTNSESQT